MKSDIRTLGMLEATLERQCEKSGDERCPSLQSAQKRFAEALPKAK